MSKKTTPVPVIALAALAGLTATQTAKEFAERVQSRRRAFVEQGKLVYHLRTLKLKAGQSVYAILQGQGVPEGSVQQAVTTADLIEILVIPGLLTEDRFDQVITHRIARQARRLINGKASIQMPAAEVAAILVSGESAAIGAELDCLCEHGLTIAARETALAEKAAEAERLKAAAAEAERLKAAEAERIKAEAAAKAEADAEAARKAAEANAASASASTPAPQPDTPETPPVEIPDEQPAPSPSAPATGPDEQEQAPAEEQEDEEQDEDEVDEPEPQALVIDSTRGGDTPPPTPAKPTLMSLTSRFNDLFIESLDLSAGDMEKLVGFLRHSTDELVSALEASKVAA